MNRNTEETYYQILKVDPKASIPEVVAAFHRAKSAFSSDSMATYSLMDGDETKQILRKIEEAHQVLTSVEKRAEYDRILHNRAEEDANAMGGDLMRSPIRPEPEHSAETPLPPATPSTETLEQVNGASLKEIRERRGFSIEDVARITKIQKKYLRAIEEDAFDALPARVYLQGFLKNLTALYKLATDPTTRAYMDYVDGTTNPETELEP